MAGSEPNNRKVELIDSTTNKSKVLQNKYETKSFDNIGTSLATGKVVLNHVLICGGYPFSKYCVKLERECQWTHFANMSKIYFTCYRFTAISRMPVRDQSAYHWPFKLLGGVITRN